MTSHDFREPDHPLAAMGHFGRVMGWELRPWQGALAAEAQRDDKLDLWVLRDRLQLEDSSRRGWRGDPSESASRLPGQLGNGLPERLAGARSPRFTGPRDGAAAAKSGGRPHADQLGTRAGDFHHQTQGGSSTRTGGSRLHFYPPGKSLLRK